MSISTDLSLFSKIYNDYLINSNVDNSLRANFFTSFNRFKYSFGYFQLKIIVELFKQKFIHNPTYK